MRRLFFCVLALLLLSTAPTCFSQQDDIRQFAVFGAYTYLATPSLNLAQRGFDGDLGYNVRPWLTFGFDFGYYTGHSTLLPNDLNPGFVAIIPPPLLPGLAAGAPYNISTQTYEAGPQLNYRGLKKVTFFVRPALGALHSNVTVLLPTAACTLLPGGCSKSDTVPFYGFGGGMTWEITPHFGLRVATDFAHYNFFSNVLNGGRNSVRVSIGPKFGFGKNILEK
jgi:hypothetical protein